MGPRPIILYVFGNKRSLSMIEIISYSKRCVSQRVCFIHNFAANTKRANEINNFEIDWNEIKFDLGYTI